MQNKNQSKRLLVKVNVRRQTDRTGDRVTANAISTGQGLDISIDDADRVAADSGTLLVVMGADLHTLDFLAGRLGLDSRNIPAGKAVVLGATEVKFTPSARVPSELVGRQVLTLGSTPGALGVIVEGNVAALARLESELQSRVTVPTGELTVGAHLVPEVNSPGVLVATLEFHNVLVLRGLVGGDFNDVATPWVTDVTLVVDVFGTIGGGLLAESLTGVLAILGSGPPVDRWARGRRRRVGISGSFSRSGGSGVGGWRGLSGLSVGGLSVGGLSSGGTVATSEVVDPRDNGTVHGSVDHFTNVTLVHVSVTTFVTVKTGGSGASGQRCEPDEGVLELHFFFFGIRREIK